jgi:hypothetical protein
MRRESYRLGWLVSSLDCEAGKTLTDSINAYYRAGKHDADLAVFFNEQSHVARPMMFARFNATEVYGYSGDVVATDLVNAAYLAGCPGPRRRFFYVDGPEWSTHRSTWTYLDFAKVYRNPRLQILAKDEEVRKLVEQTWNRKVRGVVDLADVGRIIKELRDE